MKKLLILGFAIAAFSISASAQIISALDLSASYAAMFQSLHDDIVINAGDPINDYSGDGDDWVAGSVLAGASLVAGKYDIVFVGENAGWTTNDLSILTDVAGDGSGGTSTLIFADIKDPVANTNTLTVGNFKTLTVGAGSGVGLFDFLLDSSSHGVGGLWRAIYPSENSPNPGVFEHALINTTLFPGITLFAFEDIVINHSDYDYGDAVFALISRGASVPEPSTYGIIGAIALLGLIASRRIKAKKT
ncbi:MAG: PEP-CTERM sorting domain-containing protein [Verrucomicrobia bacterium]|nr:PEP-CTERM sorting domain-containing protein [Verrucomicrobiota bacterium]MDA1068269.1 PEP-CTERM sorting domain-containing protein [Verrucomicrobiota bacterium]